MAEDKHDEEGAARPQRPLAAILAADVAGYSRLMEADEEGTLSRLQRTLREVIHPAIDRSAGRTRRRQRRRFLAEHPDFSAAAWAATQPFRNAADRDHFVESYLLAGLPA